MNCPKCNTVVSDGTNYCTNCGMNLNNPNSSAQNCNCQQNYSSCAPNFNPNCQQNNQTVNQQDDKSEKLAMTSMILGIISIFLGPVFAIVSLIIINIHNKNHKDKNEDKIMVGKICSWFSIVSAVFLILFCILFLGGFLALLSNLPA